MVIPINSYRFHVDYAINEGKPLICFLHGFLGSASDWESVAAQMSSNFATLCIDLPGHGKTTLDPLHPKWFRMPDLAYAIVALINALGYQQAYLVGYSMGGRLALYLAIHYSAVFKKCVLESSSPGLKTVAEQHARIKHDSTLAKELQTNDFSKFLEKWYNQPLFRSLKNLPTFNKLFNARLKNNPHELALSLLEMGTGAQPSLWERLNDCSSSILALAGEYDAKFRAIGEEMSLKSDAVEFEMISKAGHLIHLENQSEFINCLNQFFK